MGRDIEKIDQRKAVVSHLPVRIGDGYAWGGGTILSIGDLAIFVGDTNDCRAVADEIARLWNTAHPQEPHHG